MKRNKPPVLYEQNIQNPVAKFMHRFNKAQTHNDKTLYRRKAKHKNQEPFAIVTIRLLQKALA